MKMFHLQTITEFLFRVFVCFFVFNNKSNVFVFNALDSFDMKLVKSQCIDFDIHRMLNSKIGRIRNGIASRHVSEFFLCMIYTQKIEIIEFIFS